MHQLSVLATYQEMINSMKSFISWYDKWFYTSVDNDHITDDIIDQVCDGSHPVGSRIILNCTYTGEHVNLFTM